MASGQIFIYSTEISSAREGLGTYILSLKVLFLTDGVHCPTIVTTISNAWRN